MQTNRSMPPGTVIPELAYPDVGVAAAWLRDAFGFTERVRIGNHRIQMTIGDGSIVVVESDDRASRKCRTMVRVESVDDHYRRAQEKGAVILASPETHVFGERQYSASDPDGHTWTFSQSVADVHPSEWGGEVVSDLSLSIAENH
jgi:uncharacterized glyoxalase superfamily protein PhnB